MQSKVILSLVAVAAVFAGGCEPQLPEAENGADERVGACGEPQRQAGELRQAAAAEYQAGNDDTRYRISLLRAQIVIDNPRCFIDGTVKDARRLLQDAASAS